MVNYIEGRRVVVLSGGDTRYAYIDDPAFGRYKIEHTDFFGILDEEIVLFIDKAPAPES